MSLHGNSSLLSDRLLFATNNMIPFQRVAQQLQRFPLKATAYEGWPGSTAPELRGAVERRLTAHS